MFSFLPFALPFMLDAPYGLTCFVNNPISSFISAAAFNSLGFATGLLPPLGWT